MPITAIIFDLDGVLVDSAADHLTSWRMLGKELGIDVPEDKMAGAFGLRNQDIIPRFFGNGRSGAELKRLGDRKEEIFREMVKGRVPVMPGAVEVVQYYHENGYSLAIGSSTPRANIDLIVNEMGVASRFKSFVSAEDVTVGKPNPEVFLTAARRLNVPPADCQVVEDAPAGIEAARAAGMLAVALSGSHAVEKLNQAHRVIRGLLELIPRKGCRLP